MNHSANALIEGTAQLAAEITNDDLNRDSDNPLVSHSIASSHDS
jgi:hypothetical protein